MPKFTFQVFAGTFIMLLFASHLSFAQSFGKAGNAMPQQVRKYTIDTIMVTGAFYLDQDIMRLTSGLAKGDKVELEHDPEIAKAIKTLWTLGMFDDVRILYSKIQGDNVSLNIVLVERPRLSAIEFKGINKTAETELKSKARFSENRMVTESFKKDIIVAAKKYFQEKGFYNTKVRIKTELDTSSTNSRKMTVYINKGSKVHINAINVTGNESINAEKIKSNMKGTKEMPRISLYPANEFTVLGTQTTSFNSYMKNQGYLSLSKTLNVLNPYFRWNIFAGSKLNTKKFQEDKESIIRYYNTRGYRDAEIEQDTAYLVKNGNMNIDLKIKEGRKYYFGDIEWRGNTKYSDSILSKLIDIKRGDVYNQELLEGKMGLSANMDGSPDIGSLYMDDGYLFFRVVPQEQSIINDTINYIVTIQEGPQATIKNITISGNLKTNDHVIRRELFTMPGNKFSRADIIRSIRQISNLGYIDPEKVNPEPIPNYEDGTVDINYSIVEKSSDQLELSAGFGGGVGFTGSLGVVFNNFSLKNITNPKAWDPLPMGDGQKLSIRYQSNGLWFNSANLSFTEPWLGGKKPISLTVSSTYGRQSYSSSGIYAGSPNDHYLTNFGGGVSISKRLRWPDNNFLLSFGVNYQNYFLKDYNYFVDNFKNGSANNFFGRLTLARNSVDQPIYPRSGSNINLTFQFTPPYSMFKTDVDYDKATPNEKYKWVEYHKYRFTAEWYQAVGGDFVLKLAAKYGFLGYYNSQIGYSPFERFSVGGDGLSGYNMFVGKDLISQRGYETGYAGLVSPSKEVSNATIFNKYTAEIRYPFSLNPSATIFGLGFAEAANGWNSFQDYNPFKLYRSVGVGLRVYLPIFGLLGLDYGLGIDNLGNGVKFGGAAKFSFMLGFEPD